MQNTWDSILQTELEKIHIHQARQNNLEMLLVEILPHSIEQNVLAVWQQVAIVDRK